MTRLTPDTCSAQQLWNLHSKTCSRTVWLSYQTKKTNQKLVASPPYLTYLPHLHNTNTATLHV